MPSNNSYPKLINDWEELLEAANRETELQPATEQERQALVQSLAEVQELRQRQLEMKASRQEATRQLREAVKKGKDHAIQLRSVLKGKIGPRSERLTRFKMAPLRPRRKKPGEEEEKPNGETPGTTSGASGSPSDKPVA